MHYLKSLLRKLNKLKVNKLDFKRTTIFKLKFEDKFEIDGFKVEVVYTDIRYLEGVQEGGEVWGFSLEFCFSNLRLA